MGVFGGGNTDNKRKWSNRLLAVEGPLFAGEALANHLRVLVYPDLGRAAVAHSPMSHRRRSKTSPHLLISLF